MIQVAILSQSEIAQYVGIVVSRMMIWESGMAEQIQGADSGFFLLIIFGAFMIDTGLFDRKWFMTNRRGQILVKLLGRTVARVFCVLLGLAAFVYGTYLGIIMQFSS
jgi:hypothetical protein